MVKTPVAIQPTYTIYFERFDNKTWTHADVHQWSPKIAKEFRDVHHLLSMIHKEPFYCLVDNFKLEKFVKFLGYNFITDACCTDGVTRRIFRYG